MSTPDRPILRIAQPGDVERATAPPRQIDPRQAAAALESYQLTVALQQASFEMARWRLIAVALVANLGGDVKLTDDQQMRANELAVSLARCTPKAGQVDPRTGKPPPPFYWIRVGKPEKLKEYPAGVVKKYDVDEDEDVVTKAREDREKEAAAEPPKEG